MFREFRMVAETDDPRAAFVDASFWHGSKARADAVRRFVAQDPAHATAKGGPRNVVDGIKFPSGYREVDELLEPHIKTG